VSVPKLPDLRGCPKTLCDNFSLHFVGEVIATLVIHIKHVDPRLKPRGYMHLGQLSSHKKSLKR